MFVRTLGLAAIAAVAVSGSAVAQDAASGEKVFRKCKACHVVEDGGKHKVGPNLYGVMGRTAGTTDGFRYSKAMVKAGEEGLVWNEETLGEYLKAPKKYVKGTKMAFAGLRKEADVADVIAYIQQESGAATN